MRRFLTVVTLALVAGIPCAVAAQSPEVPPAPEPPAPAPAPPPTLDSRPMRFLLSTGAVVIGTRIGESPTAIGVQTQTGIVTVYKSQVVTMDYRVERGRIFDLRSGAAPIPIAPSAPPAPVEIPRDERPQRRHPGRGATIAGGIIFGLFYAVSALGALTALNGRSPEGALLALPVAGPLVWASIEPHDRISVAVLLTGGQTIGAALLIAGISAAHSDRGGRRFGIAPVLTAEVQGLAVAGTL